MNIRKYVYIIVTISLLFSIIGGNNLFGDVRVVCASSLSANSNFDNLSMDEIKKFYYNQLTDFEKSIYRRAEATIWDAPSFMLSSEEVAGYSYGEIEHSMRKAYAALVTDKPFVRAYWNRYCELTTDDVGNYVVTLVKPTYISNYSIEKAIAQKNRIVTTIGQDNDRYTKVRKLWNYMADTTTYDEYYIFTSVKHAGYNDSVLGVLLADTAICAGYADICKVVCDELEIPCIIVGNAGHAWNYIQMDDGKWYSIDFSINVDYSNYMLLGTSSEEYTTNSNYYLSDLYIGEVGDFEFPLLSEKSYTYTGSQTDFSYFVAENMFEEQPQQFVYKVNDDGETCTITEYIGKQEGTFKIPQDIDGYTVTEIGNEAFYANRGFSGDLIIPDTVKKIGDYAFASCTGLSGELNLSSELEEIGECAFQGCKNLKGSIEFPDSLKILSDYAFYGCTGLEGDIILPENMEHLGDSVFFLCRGLNGTFYLSEGVSWNSGVIGACSFQAINVAESNSQYMTRDGILYSKDGSVLLYCPQQKKGTVEIPDTVKEIADKAFFEVQNVTGDLILPSELKKIGEEAFRDAGFSGKLVFSDSVEEIGQLAFGGCRVSGDLMLPDSIKYIGDSAFLGCDNLDGILKLPSEIKNIGVDTFMGCNFIGKVSLPETIETIGDGAFFGIQFSGDLLFPDSVRSVGNLAFSSDQFSKVYLGKLSNIGEEAFSAKTHFASECTNEYVIEQCEVRGWDLEILHVENTKLESVDPTCTENGYTLYMCNGCGENKKEIQATGHTEVTDDAVAATCTEKGKTEGKHCSICETVIVEQKEIAATQHSWDEGKVTKEASATAEGEKLYTCKNCGATKTEKISKLPSNNNNETEEPDNSDDENTTESNDQVTVGYVVNNRDDGTEYKVTKTDGGSSTVEFTKYDGTESNIVIPDVIKIKGVSYKVTSVADNAFKNNKTVTYVILGNNVKTIGKNAFSGCKKLKTVTIGKNVTTIGSKAFYNCKSLTKITIPSKVTKIDSYAFKNCKKLSSVTIGKAVKTIGKEAFRGCSKLKSINIKSKKLKTVGKNIFKGIKSSAKIKVPSSKLKSYKKLLKNKGQSKKVKITK